MFKKLFWGLIIPITCLVLLVFWWLIIVQKDALKSVAQLTIEKEIAICKKEICRLGEISSTNNLNTLKDSLNQTYRKKMEILKSTFDGLLHIDQCGVKYSHLLIAAHYLIKSEKFCKNQDYVDAEKYLKLARSYLALAERVED